MHHLEPEPFFPGLYLDGGDESRQDPVEAEGAGIELQLAGLDLGEVKDVVEDAEQAFRRLLHRLQKTALLVDFVRVQGQVGHAEDGVHRRPDFMAHVGQKLAFGPVGCLGLFLGVKELEAAVLQVSGPFGDLLLEIGVPRLDYCDHVVEPGGQQTQFILATHCGPDIVLAFAGDPAGHLGKVGDGCDDHPEQAGGEQHGQSKAEQQHSGHEGGSGQDVVVGFGEVHLEEQVPDLLVFESDGLAEFGIFSVYTKASEGKQLFWGQVQVTLLARGTPVLGEDTPLGAINTPGGDALLGVQGAQDSLQRGLIFEGDSGAAVFADDVGQGLDFIVQLLADKVLLDEKRGGGGQHQGQRAGQQDDGVELEPDGKT